MKIRERLHDHLDLVGVFSPTSPDLVPRLVDAVYEHVQSPAGAELRRRALSGRRWRRFHGDLTAAAERTVLRVDGEPTLGDLALMTVEGGYDTLPLSIVVADTSVAMMFPHDLFDGSAAWRHIEQITTRAVGPWTEAGVSMVAAHPVVAALRSSGLGMGSRLRRTLAQSRRDAAATGVPDLFPNGVSIDRERRRDGLRVVRLDAAALRRIDTSRSRRTVASDALKERPGRATRGMRLAELVLDGIGAAVPAESDFRVRMMVDLRRFAPKDQIVLGPFSIAYPIGTLRGSDNSAAALTTRLGALLSARLPLATLVGDIASYAKRRVLHPFAPRPTGALRAVEIGISVLPSLLPEAFWASPENRISAVMMYHDIFPASPYAQIADIGDEVVISLWDETGAVELDTFVDAIRDELERRVPINGERAK